MGAKRYTVHDEAGIKLLSQDSHLGSYLSFCHGSEQKVFTKTQVNILFEAVTEDGKEE